MADWFRSITILAFTCVLVVVLTIGLATVLVPAGPVGAEPPPSSIDGPGPSTAPSATAWRPGEVGGSLTVTGDVEGTLVVGAESIDLGYELTGADGRIAFSTLPVAVSRISFGGLEIYPEGDACELTPGERDDATGVAPVDVRCDDVTDIRGNGTVDVLGRVGIAADLLGLRGDLPEPGGEMSIGGETYAFERLGSRLTVQPVHRTTPTYVGQLVTADGRAALTMTYGDAFHVEEVQAGVDLAVVPVTACTVTDREIGVLNPHTRVVELEIGCDALDLPSIGSAVELDATVVIELIELPS